MVDDIIPVMNKILSYDVVFTKEPEGGYTAVVPSLPGCVTFGKDLREVKKMVRDAIKLYLESLQEHKEGIPMNEKSFVESIDLELPTVHA